MSNKSLNTNETLEVYLDRYTQQHARFGLFPNDLNLVNIFLNISQCLLAKTAIQ